jgi:hypothetical protein
MLRLTSVDQEVRFRTAEITEEEIESGLEKAQEDIEKGKSTEGARTEKVSSSPIRIIFYLFV